ncbi:MAG TPA: hypothetical protein VFR23_08630 [Jiangellaceae bacterium]|nr:hypothetical protein [Jiangellaceae bacterium]
MKRVRLREAHDDAKLAQIYAKPHDHSRWLDHAVRVQVTVALARTLGGHVPSAADLSCGDGVILRNIDADERIFGDYAPGYPYVGRIEATVTRIPRVQLFVCCETLEHLDDPDTVLKAIRDKTHNLVLSTPVDAFGDTNIEHYHAWDREAVEDMLRAAAFEPLVYNELDLKPAGGEYRFGIWWCR